MIDNSVHPDPLPLITVAMPIYNAGKYLRLAVRSIIKQSYTNWEMLIIDDGSTDDALASIADIKDVRIQIFRDGKNRGLAARLNECIDMARGKYLARMDQDDVSYPQRFMWQVEALKSDESLDMVAVRAITIDSDNNYQGYLPWDKTQQEIAGKPWRGFYLPHPTWMGKIEWFRRFRYAEPAPYLCEDQELLLRSYANSRFDMICEPLFAYRVRDVVNWNRLLKTRKSVLSAQWRFFMKNRQVYFAILALTAFVGRLALDVLSATFSKIRLRPGKENRVLSVAWKDKLWLILNESV